MTSDTTAGPPQEPLAPLSPPPKGRERILLTGALAVAALAGNWLSLPISFGVDFLFGSIAVMLALAWLGTGAGLVVALVGGAYTWLLWDHPYALLTFLAEAAAVGWQRDRARRRGSTPPPLAVSAALYWLLLGVPLALLAHRFALGMNWTATLLIAVKQSQNGILNAALADLVLVAGVLLSRRQSALPLAQVLFGVLLAALLVPSLLLNAWENRDLKDRLEAAQADRLRLFGELAVHQLMALPPGRGADPAFLEAQLAVMRRALAENRLKQTEERLRAIIETSPHGIVEADPLTRRLLWCSASMLRLFGYGSAQWQGLTVEDMHPVESLPLVQSEFARMAQADLAPALDLPCRRRDGTTFYCKVSPGLMRLGRESTLVAFFTDVTAEHEARLALELSQESLLRAQEIARLGSWEFDIVTGGLFWSPEVFRIFEQDPERFEPSYAGMLALIHPEDRTLLDRVYRESVANRIPYELEHQLLLPDGRVKWVYERGETDYAAAGTPLKSRGTTQDITERRAATQRQQELEAALTRYNAQLEDLVDVISLPLPLAEQVNTLLWLGCHGLGVVAAVLVMTDEERGHRVLFTANDDTGNGFTPELNRALVVEALTHLGSPCVLGPERLPGVALSAGLRSCVAMAFTCPRPDGQTDTLILSLWGPEPSLDLDGPGRQIIRLIAQRIASIRYQEQVQHDLVEAKGRETIGHLASGIAHDFNNLLGVIDANIYYVEARLGELAPADLELRQVMEETQSALGQAKVVTSGMLSLSRAGGVPLESVDLGPTVAELERILRQVLPAAIDLRLAIAPGTRVWSMVRRASIAWNATLHSIWCSPTSPCRSWTVSSCGNAWRRSAPGCRSS